MRILIADDHAIMRSGLRQILTEEGGQPVFGEASNTRQVIEAALSQPWDLVILDIAMPGRNGLEALKELKAQRPKVPVLVLSMYPERQYAVRALRAGAAGYLTKASAPTELMIAVKKIMAGGRYVSASLAERLASELALPAEKPPHERLSDREYEILCLIGAGKTVSEVAAELSLSVNTVSTHRARLLAKMKLRTTAELIRYVVENQLTV